ncbi:MAG: hypothetical protein FWD17_18540, partial [Polyangiaceae bacterium]|nr:hypothetical protein [Polyangiaceae bacterium]
ATPGKLPENMTKSFDLVVSRLRAMPPQTPGVDEILCSIGMRTNDVDVLGGCVPGLAARSPNDVLTFMSQWTLAILKGDVAGARQVIENARAAGVSPETITQLEGQIATQEQKSTRATMLGGVLLVSAIVAISALVVLFRGSRKQPAGAPASTHGGPVEGVAPETNTPAA